jgi:hypothetical protein
MNTTPPSPPHNSATPATGGKRSAWMSHVKATMRANKGKPLSAVLKMAKKTYKKKGGSALTPLPIGGRRSRRGTRRSRKH